MSLQAELDARRGELTLEVALEADPGEVVAILGPNGAGKTTLLRCLAGLAPLRSGRVSLHGRVWEQTPGGTWVPVRDRRVGMLFQDQLLFPHLSVVDNVAFGPRARGRGTGEARRQAHRWLERVGLGGLAGASPGSLSGGQAQRVALARALAGQPELLLLDEPLAGLDVAARLTVRRELAEHLAAFPGPCLLVTHDPVEAIALAHRLVVIEEGRITQTGSPAAVSRQPRSRWVAELVGLNLLRGRATAGSVSLEGGGRLVAADGREGPVQVVIPPQAVALHRQRPRGSPRNVWSGRVAGLDRHGQRVRVHVEGEPSVVAEITPQAAVDLDLGRGGEVWVAVKATEIELQPR